MTRRRTVDVVHQGGDLLGEGPVWDDRDALLYRVDCLVGAVLALDPSSGAERRYDVGRPVGCVALRDDGQGLVLGAQDGFASLDLHTGATRLLAAVGHDVTRMHLNDGGCDPVGRFYAGSLDRELAAGTGVLHRYEPPSQASPVVTGIGVSNGMVWDSAGSTLFFIDSVERRVDRFRYDLADGALSDRRIAFDVAQYPGMPDGMAIDSEDCLWVTFWKGGSVRRFTPDGRLLETVELPVARTTSCCFGGGDLATLFVTTARQGLRGPLDADPLAGAVFAVPVDVSGVPASRWREDQGA